MKNRIFIMAFAGVLFMTVLSSCNKSGQPLTAGEYLSLGEKYLLELDYEQALVQFLKVIEIDPMNPRGYTGAAEAYMGLGQPDEAVAVLERGLDAIPGDAGIQAMQDELLPTESAVSDLIKVELDDLSTTESEASAASDFIVSLFNLLEEGKIDEVKGLMRTDAFAKIGWEFYSPMNPDAD